MMTLRCFRCDRGKTWVNGEFVTCSECHGTREIPVTAAADEIEAAAGIKFGSRNVAEFLDFLNDRRDLLFAWLLEIEFLRRTTRGLRPVPRDPMLSSIDKGYIRPGTTEVVDADLEILNGAEDVRRCYLVNPEPQVEIPR